MISGATRKKFRPGFGHFSFFSFFDEGGWWGGGVGAGCPSGRSRNGPPEARATALFGIRRIPRNTLHPQRSSFGRPNLHLQPCLLLPRRPNPPLFYHRVSSVGKKCSFRSDTPPARSAPRPPPIPVHRVNFSALRQLIRRVLLKSLCKMNRNREFYVTYKRLGGLASPRSLSYAESPSF